MKQRHEPFQLGTNPMHMSAFEAHKVEKERMERLEAHRKYVRGIQGRDGGEPNHEELPLRGE